MQLVSKISILCGPDPPTSRTDGQTDRQTDRRTDDMRSQYRAMHYSASRGKNCRPKEFPQQRRLRCTERVTGSLPRWRERVTSTDNVVESIPRGFNGHWPKVSLHVNRVIEHWRLRLILTSTVNYGATTKVEHTKQFSI